MARHKTTSGYAAHASTSGYAAHASTSGYAARASTSGYAARASTSGNYANASTSGYAARASTSGNYANASTSGNYANASTSGNYANASASGNYANASASGNYANASASGNGAVAFSARGVAEATGAGGRQIGRVVKLNEQVRSAVVIPPDDAPNIPEAVVTVAEGWPINTWTEFRWVDDEWQLIADPNLLLANDGRGYRLVWTGNRYEAGCRSFTYDQAVKHWSNPNHEAPDSAARLLAAVEEHHAWHTGEANG